MSEIKPKLPSLVVNADEIYEKNEEISQKDKPKNKKP